MNNNGYNLAAFITEHISPRLSVKYQYCADFRQYDIYGIGHNLKTYNEMAKHYNCSVENMRQRTLKAKRIISNILYQISEAQKTPHVIIKKVSEKELETPNLPMREKLICDLGDLSVRTLNALTNDNILLVDKLLELRASELLRIPNFGKKSLNEIIELLAKHNLKLRGNWP